MTKFHHIAALALVLAALVAGAPRAAALERGMFGWRTAEISGTRPLLVIWLREPDGVAPDELTKYRSYYHDVVFGRAGTTPASAPRGHFERSVVNYFREVSGGKFAWNRAGMVGPLSAQIKGKPASEIVRLAIEAAAIEGGIDFRPFDANRDGRIAPQELAVLVITNTPLPGRRWEEFPPDRAVAIPGQVLAFAGRGAVIGENDGFATITRQLFRLLAPEAVDLEGWPQKCFAINAGRSLMAASNTANPALTMHLDPWHKMMVGWVEPRIVPFGQSGKALLAAQHISATEESKRPLLLFDPQGGPREFFLLEYRTHSELGFDQATANSGLVIWHVALDGANRPFAVRADRPNCKGEVLRVPSLFVRSGPNWQLGGNRAYSGSDGPVSLRRWLDGKDSGVWVTTTADNPVQWHIEVAWTAPDPRAGMSSIQLIPAAASANRN